MGFSSVVTWHDDNGSLILWFFKLKILNIRKLLVSSVIHVILLNFSCAVGLFNGSDYFKAVIVQCLLSTRKPSTSGQPTTTAIIGPHFMRGNVEILLYNVCL